MRWTPLLLLLAGCGSVEPIGPPESSGESWSTSGGDAPTGSAGTDSASAAGTGDDSGTAGSSTGGSSSGTMGTGSSTGMAVDDSGSGGCAEGELGCACLPMNGCAEGLMCASGFCVLDIPCPVEQTGSETCQCTKGGGCDEGLVCASNLCVDPDG